MFQDDYSDLPPSFVDEEETPKLPPLCPKNITATTTYSDGGLATMQGPHHWEQRYRDNRPNQAVDDDHYTIYQCVYCRKYDSRWEAKQYNANPTTPYK